MVKRARVEKENQDPDLVDFKSPKGGRFKAPTYESEMKEITKGYVPENTRKSTTWPSRVFEEWVAERNEGISDEEERCPEDLLQRPDPSKLNFWLCRFVTEFISVLLAVSGIVLFAYVDGFGSANTRGVLMSVGSAVGAALYKTLLKWRVKESSLYQMSLFLSSIGVFSTLVLWPVVVLLHVSGAEMLLEIPWIYLVASSILGILFNFAINFGIAYTFPLFISLGTIMGVPLNAVFDTFIRHVDLLNWKITAMDLIIGGFLLMLAPPSLSEWIERKLYCRRGSKCY